MPLSSRLMVGFVLVFPTLALLAPAAPAPAPMPTVKRVDVVGTWEEAGNKPGPVLVTLWSDGLFWYSGGKHGGGRWRLVGDTLWMGNNGVFQYGVTDLRFEIVHADTIDTLSMPTFN